MKNKTKNITAIALVITGISLLVMGSLAIFTSRDDSGSSVTAGNLDVSVTIDGLTNMDSISPGDNDPKVLADETIIDKGADHILSFTVNNTGNKAIKTRHTVIIEAYGKDNLEQLDASMLKLFNEDMSTELIDKIYIAKDGEELIDPSTYEITAIKYVYLSDSFDGLGEKAELRDSGSDLGAETAKTYNYKFGLMQGADNSYQGADIKFTVLVEAIQYFNTNDETWTSVSTVIGEYSSNKAQLNTVPASNEDSEGNLI